jgi:hypothetical protein
MFILHPLELLTNKAPVPTKSTNIFLIKGKNMQNIFAYAGALYSYLFRIISEIKIFNFRYLSSGHYIYFNTDKNIGG